jgi:hypothetical protein
MEMIESKTKSMPVTVNNNFKTNSPPDCNSYSIISKQTAFYFIQLAESCSNNLFSTTDKCQWFSMSPAEAQTFFHVT